MLTGRLVSRRAAASLTASSRRAFAASSAKPDFDVLIVGGGAGGISTASSLLKRRRNLNIGIVEPRDVHYYQPGWTLVGAGVFNRPHTVRTMQSVMPKGVNWVKSSVSEFQPEQHQVVLDDGKKLGYRVLVASPGLKLNWDGIEGLNDTLGKNGVTSNYHWDHAPYTWELVQKLNKGRAIFTQSPMPIKCAGAPQKAMYLSCDHWKKRGVLKDIEVEFHTATPGLFGVKDFVPALMEYVRAYNAHLNFQSNLKAVDGPAKKAVFTVTKDGKTSEVEREFDFMHVTPPQLAPDFIRNSPLAESSPAGWIEVDQTTLQHVKYRDVFGLGDAASTPNAKTAAAVRMMAPTVAENVVTLLDGKELRAGYNGYGACPLTVERGKVVMAEFGYGGKLLPTFPQFLLRSTKATRAGWFVKKSSLPWVYFNLVLRGHEWLAKPMMKAA